MAMPEGNAVESTFTGFAAAFVTAELPAHDRTPNGPSAILIAGIPSRSIGMDSIQPDPASIEAFSSSVMRLSRSATRCSTGVAGFLYGALAETGACAGSSTAETTAAKKQMEIRHISVWVPLALQNFALKSAPILAQCANLQQIRRAGCNPTIDWQD